MIEADLAHAAQVVHPDAGMLRVHPDPAALPHPTPEEPGSNRFDDPAGIVPVRYAATTLRGCLLETMARFRLDPEAAARIRAVKRVGEDDLELDFESAEVLEDWLTNQQVGTVTVLDAGSFVDIEHPRLMVQLDKHPLVRGTLERIDPSAQLDVGLLRLRLRGIGRAVTQAVSVAVRDWLPHALGIGYRSRLDSDEPLWAIWAPTRVAVTSVPLDPSVDLHLRAVNEAATTFELELPARWQIR